MVQFRSVPVLTFNEEYEYIDELSPYNGNSRFFWLNFKSRFSYVDGYVQSTNIL